MKTFNSTDPLPTPHPRNKYEILILVGEHAGATTLAYEYHDYLYCLDLGVAFKKSWYWDAGDKPADGAEYANLGTPWDGRGDRILVGDRVFYCNGGEVRIGTVVKYGGRSKNSGYRTIKINIKPDADPRDHEWNASKIYICDDPTNCILTNLIVGDSISPSNLLES